MIRKEKTRSITIISVMMLLTCLFFSVIGASKAWFVVSDPNRIEINVLIEDLQLSLYQNSIAPANKIDTLSKNSYITLSGPIESDVSESLTLILKNEDASGGSRYVRFKFEVMVSGTDTALSGVTISGSDETKNDANIFSYINNYYYYTGTDSIPTSMDSNDQATMLTGFTIPYSSMKNLKHSESLKIVLTIETSATSSF